VKIIRKSGKILRDITYCKTYDEYLEMAQSAVNITYIPTAKTAGEVLERRLGAKHLYLPASFDFEEIRENYKKLCDTIGVEVPDFSQEEMLAKKALETALQKIGSTAVAVDFTAVTRPFGFAKMLCEHGFNVEYIVADVISEEDKSAFEWLKQNRPKIILCSAVNTQMQFWENEKNGKNILAVGQKAAYYMATDNFVNIVSNGGYYGFSGICAIAELMVDAYLNPKDRRTVIQRKGLGCESCL
jgi:nitrogenase molybdenum-iron protein alpha/beta subunit